mmetsp:Transcript_23296/g.63129  ORF Transcript_23296/g.63129 Transcript_23296/m.63129 type:complete len:964 (-) Transcript_23296:355-3246(-)
MRLVTRGHPAAAAGRNPWLEPSHCRPPHLRRWARGREAGSPRAGLRGRPLRVARTGAGEKSGSPAPAQQSRRWHQRARQGCLPCPPTTSRTRAHADPAAVALSIDGDGAAGSRSDTRQCMAPVPVHPTGERGKGARGSPPERHGGDAAGVPVQWAAHQKMHFATPEEAAEWNRAAVLVQAARRGYVVRNRFKRGGTMFKRDYSYMTMRQLTQVEALALVAFCVLHQVLFVVTFTEPGFGDELFRALAPQAALAFAIGWCGLVVFLLIYLFDAHLFSKAWMPAVYASGFIAGLLVVAGLVMTAGIYPQAPLCVYFFLVPTLLYGLRLTVLKRVRMASFLFAIAWPSVLGGTVTLVGWIIWVYATDSLWDARLWTRYYELVLCEPDAASCLPASLLYFAPMGSGLMNIAFGFTAYLLGESVRPKEHKTLHIMVRIFALAAFLVICAMYVQAAVSGGNAQLANTVLLFSISGLVLMAVLVANAVGWEMLQRRFLNIPLIKKIQQSFMSDWAKAGLVFGGTVPFCLWMASALVKQQVRKCFWLPGHLDAWHDIESGMTIRRADLLTFGATQTTRLVSGWAWTSVLSKAVWLGVFFMIMNVGFGKMTNLFVSWLIQTLLSAGIDVAGVIGIFIAVGVLLFMLPPVPGAGIYYMAPVILTQVMEFSVAIAVSIGVSFFLKLAALVIQQKVIGEGLGSLVSVRSLARVNSVHTRAVREVLSAPGWTRGKVAILIGGPDWPTSVLTGILRLNVFSMMLGTTPIIVIIAAFVVNGAYLTVREANETTGIIYNISLAVALSVGIGSQLGALHYIVTTVEKKRADLEAEPNDPEVAARDEEKEKEALELREATRWKGNEEFGLAPAPVFVKVNILAGVVVQVGLCYILGIWPTVVFAAFTYADTIEDRLGGDWTRIATSQGRWILVTWVASWLCLFVYQTWAKHRVGALTRASMSKAYKGGTAKNSSSATENAP